VIPTFVHTAYLVGHLLALAFRSRAQLETEILFLRRQLAMYQERGVKPRRPDPPSRWLLGLLSRWFDWRDALVVVRPETLIRWQRNHSPHLIATDFFTVVTAKFDLLRVLIVMEIASRRILHFNVTEHPTAQWTLQQFREALPWEHHFRYLIHDRDSIFSASLDESLRDLGLEILKTPPRSPKANAHCERLIGTVRRECVDHVIPLGELHLRRILREWIGHYNCGRPHSALGPGLPQPPELPTPLQAHRHLLPDRVSIDVKAVLGGLHHEYRLRPAPS